MFVCLCTLLSKKVQAIFMKPCRIMHCCSVKNPLNFGVIPAHCSQLPALLDL